MKKLIISLVVLMSMVSCTKDPITPTMPVEQLNANEFLMNSQVKDVLMRIRHYNSVDSLKSTINGDSVYHYEDYGMYITSGDTVKFGFNPLSFRGINPNSKWVTVDVYFEQTTFSVHFADSVTNPYIVFN